MTKTLLLLHPGWILSFPVIDAEVVDEDENKGLYENYLDMKEACLSFNFDLELQLNFPCKVQY